LKKRVEIHFGVKVPLLHREGNEPDILKVKEKRGGPPEIESILCYCQID
jgi:hypothetical protein